MQIVKMLQYNTIKSRCELRSCESELNRDTCSDTQPYQGPQVIRVSRTSDTLTQVTQMSLIKPQFVVLAVLSHRSAVLIQSRYRWPSSSFHLWCRVEYKPYRGTVLQSLCTLAPQHLAFHPCIWQSLMIFLIFLPLPLIGLLHLAMTL